MDDKRNEIKSTIMNRIQMINNEMNKKSSQQSKNDNIQNRRWNYANTNAIRTLERQQQKQQKSSQIIESSISNEPNKKMSTINSFDDYREKKKERKKDPVKIIIRLECIPVVANIILQ